MVCKLAQVKKIDNFVTGLKIVKIIKWVHTILVLFFQRTEESRVIKKI
jgi:hypothetical protein